MVLTNDGCFKEFKAHVLQVLTIILFMFLSEQTTSTAMSDVTKKKQNNNNKTKTTLTHKSHTENRNEVTYDQSQLCSYSYLTLSLPN
jgi:hypothetical protein